MQLQERFRPIYQYHGPERVITFYDVKHFEERVVTRGLQYLHQTREAIIDALHRGCLKIDHEYEFAYGDYMVISQKVGVKIPITVVAERHSGVTIGMIPTLLINSTEEYDQQREYYKNVLVESKKRIIAIPQVDDFIDFYENGEFIPSYEIVNV